MAVQLLAMHQANRRVIFHGHLVDAGTLVVPRVCVSRARSVATSAYMSLRLAVILKRVMIWTESFSNDSNYVIMC